jgi:hypothetical protein
VTQETYFEAGTSDKPPRGKRDPSREATPCAPPAPPPTPHPFDPLANEYAANAQTLGTWRGELDHLAKESQALQSRQVGLRNKVTELAKRQQEIHAELMAKVARP